MELVVDVEVPLNILYSVVNTHDHFGFGNFKRVLVPHLFLVKIHKTRHTAVSVTPHEISLFMYKVVFHSVSQFHSSYPFSFHLTTQSIVVHDWYHWRFLAVCIRNGTLLGIFVIFFDISARKLTVVSYCIYPQ